MYYELFSFWKITMIISLMHVLINCTWNDDKLKFCIDVTETLFASAGFEHGSSGLPVQQSTYWAKGLTHKPELAGMLYIPDSTTLR